MIVSKVIKAKGYTIEKVAEKMGISRGTLANMIGGNPTVTTLERIANVIGCSRADFFADELPDNPLSVVIDGTKYVPEKKQEKKEEI